jgi:D-arabinose 1-dehydrogenase-like Zn-dependent alcohol dehydrogenase
MAFAVSVVARGGKVVSGLMSGNFNLPMVQWVYKRMTIEGFMVGTVPEAKELMALARAGKIVGRIVLKN